VRGLSLTATLAVLAAAILTCCSFALSVGTEPAQAGLYITEDCNQLNYARPDADKDGQVVMSGYVEAGDWCYKDTTYNAKLCWTGVGANVGWGHFCLVQVRPRYTGIWTGDNGSWTWKWWWAAHGADVDTAADYGIRRMRWWGNEAGSSNFNTIFDHKTNPNQYRQDIDRWGCGATTCYYQIGLACLYGNPCPTAPLTGDNRPRAAMANVQMLWNDVTSPSTVLTSSHTLKNGGSDYWQGSAQLSATVSDSPQGIFTWRAAWPTSSTGAMVCFNIYDPPGYWWKQAPCRDYLSVGVTRSFSNIVSELGQGAARPWSITPADPGNNQPTFNGSTNVDGSAPTIANVDPSPNSNYIRSDQADAGFGWTGADNLSGFTTSNPNSQLARSINGGAFQNLGNLCTIATSGTSASGTCPMPLDGVSDGDTVSFRNTQCDRSRVIGSETNSYSGWNTTLCGSATVTKTLDDTPPYGQLTNLGRKPDWVRGTITPSASVADSVSQIAGATIWTSDDGGANWSDSNCQLVNNTTLRGCDAIDTTAYPDGHQLRTKLYASDVAGNGASRGDLTSPLSAAYYKFEDPAVPALADASGNNRPLTPSRIALGQAANVFGDGVAARFNGGTSHAYALPGGQALAPESGSFTVEAWVRANPNSGSVLTVAVQYEAESGGSYSSNTNKNNYWLLRLNNGRPQFYGRSDNAATFDVQTSSDLRDGSWHHIAGVIDRSAGLARVYIDGASAAQVPLGAYGASNDGGAPVRVGTYVDAAGTKQSYFEGALADIAIYKRALTPGEVAARYSARTGTSAAYGDMIRNDNPVAYWRLDEPAGVTTAADSSGNSRHGYLTHVGHEFAEQQITPDGIIRLRGLARAQSSYTSSNTLLARFPGDRRPAWTSVVSAVAGSPSYSTSRVDLRSNGDIAKTATWNGSDSGAALNWHSLSGMLAKAGSLSWQPLSFNSPWTNYGGEYGTASSAKDADGIVHLRGLVRNTASFSGAQIIATLPPGRRPTHRVTFPAVAHNGSAYTTARIQINPDGTVGLYNQVGAALGAANGWISLDNISFPAADSTTVTAPFQYAAGWKDYDTSVYPPAKASKTADGYVYLSGFADPVVTFSGSPTIGYLPPGMRPDSVVITHASAWDGLSQREARVDVFPTGEVKLQAMWPTSGTYGSANSWVALDNIRFPAGDANGWEPLAYRSPWDDYTNRDTFAPLTGKTGALSWADSNRAIDYANGASVAVPSSAVTGATSGFTFSAWVYWRGGEDWQNLFSAATDGSTNYFYVTPAATRSGIKTALISLREPNMSISQTVEVGRPFPINQWVHFAVTLDGNVVRFYFNGSKVAEDAFTKLPSDLAYPDQLAALLGKGVWNQTVAFNGLIDEVAIYHRALTADEIHDDHQAGLNNPTLDTRSYRIDNTPPIDTTPDDDIPWQRDPVTITVSGTDATSGLDELRWVLSGAQTGSGAGPSGSAVTINQPGATVIETTAVDNAGNTSEPKTRTVYYDPDAPTVSADCDNGWYNQPRTCTITAADQLSGVDRIEWQLDGGAWVEGSQVTIATAGMHVLNFRAVDAAGNTSATGTRNIGIDPYAPADTSTCPSGWQTAPVTCTVQGADTGGSGVAGVHWRFNGIEQPGSPSANNPTHVTINAEGITRVSTGITDGAGNFSGWSEDHEVKIDLSDPTGEIKDPARNSDYLRHSFTPTAINVADAVSGVASWTFEERVDSGAWTELPGCGLSATTIRCSVRDITNLDDGATYTLRLTVIDHAGRQTVSELTHTIDKTEATDSIVDPTPDSPWVRGAYTPQGTVADATSGADGARLQERINANPWADLAGCAGTGAIACATHDTATHADGDTETLRILGRDAARNDRYSRIVLADNPVGYWAFDETAGIIADDEGSGSNDGAISGGVTHTADGAPVSGNRRAYAFDGTGQVTVPDSQALNPTDQLTVELWMRTGATNKTLLRKQYQYWLWITSTGGLRFTTYNNPTTFTNSYAPAINDGNWHHIVAIATASEQRLYVDGQLVDADPRSGALATTSNNLYIGSHGTGERFTGLIDEVAIYRTALDEARVNTHHDISFPSVTNTIDNTPPTLTVTGDPGSGWIGGDQKLTLTATDAVSGLDEISWQINGGPVQTSDSSPAFAQFDTDGIYDWVVWASDNAGNVTAQQSGTIRIDVTPPTVSLACTPPGWTNTPPTCTLTTDDTTSGVDVREYRVETTPGSGDFGPWQTVAADGDLDLGALKQGAVEVQARVTDAAGNTATASAHYRYDTGAPAVELAHPGDHIRGIITLQADAADAVSGVERVRFYYSPHGQDAWVEACADTASPYTCDLDTTALANGRYDFRAVAIDRAGNTAEDVETGGAGGGVHIDNTPPTASLSGLQTGVWYTGTVTVTVDAFDAESGVASARLQVREPGGSWEDAPAPCDNLTHVSGTTYTCDLDTSKLPEGARDVRAVAVDRAGNTGYSQIVSPNFDNRSPQVTLNPIPNFIRGTITLQASATDDGSGVHEVRIERAVHGTGVWVEVCAKQAPPYTCEFDTTSYADGTKFDFRAVATDNVSNQAISSDQRERMVDNVAPVDASRFEGETGIDPEWRANDQVVEVVFDDGDGSGVDRVEWELRDKQGNWLAGGYGANGTRVEINREGENDLSVRATDLAGNTSDWVTHTIRIDKTKPTVEFQGVPDGWVNAPVGFYVIGNDNGGSGAVTVSWTVDGEGGPPRTDRTSPAQESPPYDVEGVHLVSATARDAAGNVSDVVTTELKLDFSAPTDCTVVPSDPVKADLPIEVCGTDPASGVKKVEWRVESNGQTVTSGEGPNMTGPTLTQEGKYTIHTRIHDNAGNVSTWREHGPVIIDRTDPTIEISGYESGWRNTNLTLTVTAADNVELDRIEWAYADGSWDATDVPAGAARASEVTHTFSKEGARVVRYRAVDAAGNVSAWRDLDVKIDKTGPTATIAGGGSKVQGIYQLMANAQDLPGPGANEASGVAASEFYWCTGTSECQETPGREGLRWELLDHSLFAEMNTPETQPVCSANITPQGAGALKSLSCYFNSARMPNGTYFLRLKVRDAAGNWAWSEAIDGLLFRNDKYCPVSL
jgi:hypothetical protein